MQADLTHLPPALGAVARTAWEHILERAPAPLGDGLAAAVAAEPVASQLPRVLACSPFVADLARRMFSPQKSLADAIPDPDPL